MDWNLVSSGELSGNDLLHSRIRTIVSPFSQVSYYTDGTIKKTPPPNNPPIWSDLYDEIHCYFTIQLLLAWACNDTDSAVCRKPV